MDGAHPPNMAVGDSRVYRRLSSRFSNSPESSEASELLAKDQKYQSANINERQLYIWTDGGLGVVSLTMLIRVSASQLPVICLGYTRLSLGHSCRSKSEDTRRHRSVGRLLSLCLPLAPFILRLLFMKARVGRTSI